MEACFPIVTRACPHCATEGHEPRARFCRDCGAALGASARGTAHPDDERTIAAARVWLRFVDDEQAARLLARPTVAHDPLAVALDCYASSIPVHEEVTAR